MFLSDILNVPFTIDKDIENNPTVIKEIKSKLYNPNRKVLVDNGKVKKLLSITPTGGVNLIMNYGKGLEEVLNIIKTPKPEIDASVLNTANINLETKIVKLKDLNKTYIPFKNLNKFDMEYTTSDPKIKIEKTVNGIAIIPTTLIDKSVNVSLELKEQDKTPSTFNFTVEPESNVGEAFDFKMVNDSFSEFASNNSTVSFM